MPHTGEFRCTADIPADIGGLMIKATVGISTAGNNSGLGLIAVARTSLLS